MHVSGAASLGAFDQDACAWDLAALRRAGLDGALLPEVTPRCALLGEDKYGAPVSCGIGDNQEALRAWYTYTMDFLNGNITIEEWAEKHNENQLRYLPDVMAASEISDADLENPQNEPTGN